MTERFFSYAQNREDFHLASMFFDVETGFYVDVGGGHVVADNVTAHFYHRGWRGIVVEPQQHLAGAYRRVRPRDIVVTDLAGAAIGEAEFHEAAEYHGLSTTVAANAALSAEHGVASVMRRVPVTTLAALCAAYAPADIHLLKIDVEGAESAVLAGNDWARFRPWVIVIEAVSPWTMADTSAAFEPILRGAGYSPVFFDGLNRFYLAEERRHLAARLPETPADWGDMDHLGELGPAQDQPRHPDHALARHLPDSALARLNQLTDAECAAFLPPGCDPADPAIRWSLARIAAFHDGGFV